MNQQLDFNDESDVISALNYILPYLSEGNLEDVESTLLPFIKILFSNVQDGDKSVRYLTNNTESPSLEPGPNNSTYKNKLRKLSFLENLLDAEIQEKNAKVKKKEKTAMLIPPRLLGPKFKRQIFPKKLETGIPGWRSGLAPAFGPGCDPGDPGSNPTSGSRHYKEVDVQSTQGKQSAQSFVKNVAKERRLSRPSPRELEQLRMAQRPRKLVGNSVHTEPSLIEEHKAAASSFLKQYIMGSPSASTAPKSLPRFFPIEQHQWKMKKEAQVPLLLSQGARGHPRLSGDPAPIPREAFPPRKLANDAYETKSKGEQSKLLLERTLFFHSLLHKRCSIQRESQEGFFWRRRPLWLRHMYRPLNATRKKNMAQKLQERDSSDEDEIFNKEPGEKGDAPAEKPQAADSAAGDTVIVLK
ncbi:Leucine-rich repeat-containing protein 37A [Vulpes lagopus]